MLRHISQIVSRLVIKKNPQKAVVCLFYFIFVLPLFHFSPLSPVSFFHSAILIVPPLPFLCSFFPLCSPFTDSRGVGWLWLWDWRLWCSQQDQRADRGWPAYCRPECSGKFSIASCSIYSLSRAWSPAIKIFSCQMTSVKLCDKCTYIYIHTYVYCILKVHAFIIMFFHLWNCIYSWLRGVHGDGWILTLQVHVRCLSHWVE